MNNITEKEIRNLEDILLRFGEAHNMLAKTSLSKEEYQPISGLLAKAKVELFNFCNDHKAALQNKVSDEEPNKDDIIKEAKRLWKIPNKLEAVKLIFKLGYSLKDAKAYCEDNFDKVSDISVGEILRKHLKPLYNHEGDLNDFIEERGEELIAAMIEYASIVNQDVNKEITRLQEKYDENGYDCPPIIKLQRIEAHIDSVIDTYHKIIYQ